MSYLLEVPVGYEDTSSALDKKKSNTTSSKSMSGLTYKQQLKQDAVLWAEFLYSEYKRNKALTEETQIMPTHYDNPDA